MKRNGSRMRTRDRILDEVERLIALKGVHGFKLRDAAQRLHLSVPAIYKHYRSREDVLGEVARRLSDLLLIRCTAVRPGAAPPSLRSSLERLVEFALRRPAYVRLVLIDLATPRSLSRGWFDVAHDRLRAILREGAPARQGGACEAADSLRAALSAVLMRLVIPDDRLLMHRPNAANIRSVKRWVWDSLRARPEARTSRRVSALRRLPENRTGATPRGPGSTRSGGR